MTSVLGKDVSAKLWCSEGKDVKNREVKGHGDCWFLWLITWEAWGGVPGCCTRVAGGLKDPSPGLVFSVPSSRLQCLQLFQWLPWMPRRGPKILSTPAPLHKQPSTPLTWRGVHPCPHCPR